MRAHEEADEGHPVGPEERESGRKRSAPSAAVVYEAIRAEGEDELSRSTAALAWSGIAAGLSMGFSLVAQGLLRVYLPNAGWAPLVVRLGYALGFLVVVLGRQQLFTENTLTAIIPLLAARTSRARDLGRRARNVARLWAVVLAANLLGALLFAIVVARTGVFVAVVARYVAPALVGNVIGGVTLTTALNHAQVVAGEG